MNANDDKSKQFNIFTLSLSTYCNVYLRKSHKQNDKISQKYSDAFRCHLLINYDLQ